MYGVSSPPNVMVVKQPRSLCSRVVGFVMTMVTFLVIVSLIMSGVVLMTASPEQLQNFVADVNKASEDLVRQMPIDVQPPVTGQDSVEQTSVEQASVEQAAVEPALDTHPALEDDFVMMSDSAMAQTAQVSQAEVTRRVLSRSLRVVLGVSIALVVLAAVAAAAFFALQTVYGLDAMVGEASSIWDTVSSFFVQLGNEIADGAVFVYHSIVTFDYVGFFEACWHFIQDCFAEFWDNVTGIFTGLFSRASPQEDLPVPIFPPAPDAGFQSPAAETFEAATMEA